MAILRAIYTDEEVEKQIEDQAKGFDLTKPVCFCLKSALEGTSKNGNEMFTLTFSLWQGNYVYQYDIRDYLMINMPGLAHKKLKSFMRAIDCIDMYESGEISPYELLRKIRTGKGMLAEEEYLNDKGDKKKKYVISEYLAFEEEADEKTFDDEIPF